MFPVTSTDASRYAESLRERGLHIAAEFANFRVDVMPSSQPHEVEAARIAFFAGAAHTFAKLYNVLPSGIDPSSEDKERMEQIQVELGEHVDGHRNRAFLS
jgi:hypothetical protein